MSGLWWRVTVPEREVKLFPRLAWGIPRPVSQFHPIFHGLNPEATASRLMTFLTASHPEAPRDTPTSQRPAAIRTTGTRLLPDICWDVTDGRGTKRKLALRRAICRKPKTVFRGVRCDEFGMSPNMGRCRGRRCGVLASCLDGGATLRKRPAWSSIPETAEEVMG